MTKTILMAVLLILISSVTWAQTLDDNEYYQKMLDLKAKSEQAFDDGDYSEARQLAEKAQGYKGESERWIATRLEAYRAKATLKLLRDRLAQIFAWNAKRSYPEEYSEGTKLYHQSSNEFHDGAYLDSRDTSRQALKMLSFITAPDTMLPAYYMIRLLPGNTDCLWNIAGYDFIYNNAWEWRRLYNANKDILEDRNNPDYILPGMKLAIPPLDGEVRSGTWDNGVLR